MTELQIVSAAVQRLLGKNAEGMVKE